MHRSVWKPLIVLVALLGLVGAACGVSGGEDAASDDTETTAKPTTTESEKTTTTEDEPETTEPDGLDTELDQAMVDAVTSTYVELGFTEEEASCLAEGLVAEMGDGTESPDLTAMMDVINGCDIDPSRLGEIGSDLGAGTTEDGVRAGMVSSFKTAGLSEEQATCLADAYIEEYGIDTSAATDMSKLQALFESCDVSLDDFTG